MRGSWKERFGFWLERFSRAPGWLWRHHGTGIGVDGQRWNRYVNRVNGHLVISKNGAVY